jgi:hypothetical protein
MYGRVFQVATNYLFLSETPNAGHQARREAGAQRTLYAVACMPSLGQDWANGT